MAGIKRKLSKPGNSTGQRMMAFSREYASSAAVVALVAGGTVGGGLLLIWLWGCVTGLDEFQLRPEEQAVVREPHFNVPAFRADLVRRGNGRFFGRRVSIFKRRLTQEVAAAYAASPWVRRVEFVRKKFPRQLEIKLEVRKPFAFVRHGEKLRLLSRDAMVLSQTVYRIDNPDSWKPFIILKTSVCDSREGQVWDDDAVRAGLALLTVLVDNIQKAPLFDELRVSRSFWGSQKISLTLHTAGGAKVIWGRPPTDRVAATENSTAQKAAALQKVIEEQGGTLDALKSPVDLRRGDIHVR